MTVTVLIQARMGSTRLPGKVLKEIAGGTMLLRVVERVSRSTLADRVVIATSTLPGDNVIEDFCRTHGILCGRGSEQDVLDRFYSIITNRFPSDIIVRITSDCPLIDPSVMDAVIRKVVGSCGRTDYACNFLPERTYPRGLDTEAFTYDALRLAWEECESPELREHVTPYIYRNPDIFRIAGVSNHRDLSAMRWTVDTSEDLAFVRRVYSHFPDTTFSWLDVVNLVEKNPELQEINAHIVQKTV